MVGIVLAEDHLLVREGIRALLEREPAFEILGEARTGLEAVQLVQLRKPAILLLDLTLPKLHGMEVLAQLKRKKSTKVIILSMHGDEPSVMEAFRLGAWGFILKDTTGAALVAAIKTVVDGGRYVSESLQPLLNRAVRDMANGQNSESPACLSRRELLVLQKVAMGLPSASIARELGISSGTVAKHRASIIAKTKAKSQVEMVLYAIRRGLIKP